MAGKSTNNHVKIINIILYVLIVLVLLAFSVFSFFIFKKILIIIPIVFSLIVVYLIIFFLYTLIINPIKNMVIDTIFEKDSIKIIYKDRETIYKYKDVAEYKIITNRKDDIIKMVLLFDLNSELVLRSLSMDEYENIISNIEGLGHEN